MVTSSTGEALGLLEVGVPKSWSWYQRQKLCTLWTGTEMVRDQPIPRMRWIFTSMMGTSQYDTSLLHNRFHPRHSVPAYRSSMCHWEMQAQTPQLNQTLPNQACRTRTTRVGSASAAARTMSTSASSRHLRSSLSALAISLSTNSPLRARSSHEGRNSGAVHAKSFVRLATARAVTTSKLM